MIGLDTNILARFYIDDSSDVEAKRQRPAAQNLINSGQPLMICKTVIIELEWVMRANYKMKREKILAVYQHMLGLTHIAFEDRTALIQALLSYEQGIAFADALHHASYQDCDQMASFDERKFARRVTTLSLHPPAIIPS